MEFLNTLGDFIKGIDFKTVFFTIATLIGVYFLKPYISHFFQLKESKLQNNHTEKLQVDNFVRNLSGKEMYTLFYEWQKILLDTENSIMSSKKNKIQHTKDLTNLLLRTFSYGSAKTIEILAAYSQFNYTDTTDIIDEEDPSKTIKTSYVTLYFFAKIISSLKKDFSGQEVPPEDLLKIKIKDFEDNYDEILKANNYIRENYKV